MTLLPAEAGLSLTEFSSPERTLSKEDVPPYMYLQVWNFFASINHCSPSTRQNKVALGLGKYLPAPLSAIIWKDSRVDSGLVEDPSKNSPPCHVTVPLNNPPGAFLSTWTAQPCSTRPAD